MTGQRAGKWFSNHPSALRPGRSAAQFVNQKVGEHVFFLSHSYLPSICINSLVNSRAASNEAARVFHDQWITGLVPAWTPTHAPAAPGAPTHH